MPASRVRLSARLERAGVSVLTSMSVRRMQAMFVPRGESPVA